MILAKLKDFIVECKAGYENMNAFAVAIAIRTFTWNVFADHYIEAAKSRAYNRDSTFSAELQKGAWYTLHKCLETILKLLAPICPFITEALWLELYSDESIHVQRFPEENLEWENELGELLLSLIEFNNAIWRYKKSKGLALNQELTMRVYVPAKLKPLKDDLKSMHMISELVFGKPEGKERLEELADGIFVQ